MTAGSWNICWFICKKIFLVVLCREVLVSGPLWQTERANQHFVLQRRKVRPLIALISVAKTVDFIPPRLRKIKRSFRAQTHRLRPWFGLQRRKKIGKNSWQKPVKYRTQKSNSGMLQGLIKCIFYFLVCLCFLHVIVDLCAFFTVNLCSFFTFDLGKPHSKYRYFFDIENPSKWKTNLYSLIIPSLAVKLIQFSYFYNIPGTVRKKYIDYLPYNSVMSLHCLRLR